MGVLELLSKSWRDHLVVDIEKWPSANKHLYTLACKAPGAARCRPSENAPGRERSLEKNVYVFLWTWHPKSSFWITLGFVISVLSTIMSWALFLAQKSTFFAPNAHMLLLRKKWETSQTETWEEAGTALELWRSWRQGLRGDALCSAWGWAGAWRQPAIFFGGKRNQELVRGLWALLSFEFALRGLMVWVDGIVWL